MYDVTVSIIFHARLIDGINLFASESTRILRYKNLFRCQNRGLTRIASTVNVTLPVVTKSLATYADIFV